MSYEDPTPLHPRVDWNKIAARARARPGTWVKVDRDLNKSVATMIRMGKYAVIKPEEFEVTTRQIDDAPRGRVTLYVRTRT